jgi:hypothetical protein
MYSSPAHAQQDPAAGPMMHKSQKRTASQPARTGYGGPVVARVAGRHAQYSPQNAVDPKPKKRMKCFFSFVFFPPFFAKNGLLPYSLLGVSYGEPK